MAVLTAIPIFFACQLLTGQEVNATATGGHQAFVKDGIRVEFSMEHPDANHSLQTFREGDDARFIFLITDTASRKPVSGAYPAAWMQIDEAEGSAADERTCKTKIETFLSGGLFGRPELDLNTYYVLALNEDPTLTVVDPLFSYGGSKLLAMIKLHARGKDWALSHDNKRIFVTTPETREIAVIETSGWKISRFISLGHAADRMVLQPDGHYLWAAYQDGPEELAGNSGVAVIDPESLEIKAFIATGSGAHDVVISDDNRYAFVSNYNQGTVTVIEVSTLQKTADIKTTEGPGFMAWSPASRALYVTHQTDGSITCIDGYKMAVNSRIPADQGISRIRFAPDGRFGFIVNPQQNLLYILDAATNKIVQRGHTEAVPDQVTFSNALAYIRHRGSELVLMVPLTSLGAEGGQISVADLPAGNNPPGKTLHPCLADGIVKTPGESAVVIANPLDESIYFYKEGMAAPMGNFSNFSHRPLAVMVVDRSFKETAPGRYETIARLSRPGKYCLAVFINAPRMGHCFEVDVEGNGDIGLARTIASEGTLKITPLFSEREEPVGKNVLLRFAIHPHDKAVPITGLKDVHLLYLTNSGQWSNRLVMSENSKVPGVYETTLQFPKPGVYSVYLSCESRGLTFDNPQQITIRAVEETKE